MISKDTHSQFILLFYDDVDIDGLRVRDEFAQLIIDTGSKTHYHVAHEWCCGHGAIGFKVLELGLCDHLILTDKYQPAITGCDFSRTLNNLESQITLYHTDDLATVPSNPKWDLVIANPPWRSVFHPGPPISASNMRKMFDIDWAAHRNFYQNVRDRLTSDADCYVYEDSRFSQPKSWQNLFDAADLVLCDVTEKFGAFDTGYVMHLRPIS